MALMALAQNRNISSILNFRLKIFFSPRLAQKLPSPSSLLFHGPLFVARGCKQQQAPLACHLLQPQPSASRAHVSLLRTPVLSSRAFCLFFISFGVASCSACSEKVGVPFLPVQLAPWAVLYVAAGRLTAHRPDFCKSKPHVTAPQFFFPPQILRAASRRRRTATRRHGWMVPTTFRDTADRAWALGTWRHPSAHVETEKPLRWWPDCKAGKL